MGRPVVVAPAPGAGNRQRHRRALVVSHGGATVDLVRDLAGDDRVALYMDGIPNCALTTLVHDGAWRVVAIGQ